MNKRIYALLDKIAGLERTRYRSEDALQWIKRFIYETKGTCQPQDEWCELFLYASTNWPKVGIDNF